MQTHSKNLPKLLAALLLSLAFTGCSSKAKKTSYEASAKRYYDAGAYEKAKIEYMNVLKLDPGNDTAISQLGRIWTEQGAASRAIPFLMEACKRAPADVAMRNKLALAFMSLGHVAEARREAAAILELAPNDGAALLVLVQTARTPEDVKSTREALTRFPDRNSAALHLASVVFLARGKDMLSAEGALENALATDPKSVTAHVTLAHLRLAKKDISGADEEFKAAAGLAPLRSAERLRYAEFKFQQGAQDEARRLVAEITSQAPDYLPAWILSAQMALAAKNDGEALASLDKVFAIDTENYEARLLQSQVWMIKGEPKSAIGILEKLVESRPHPVVQFHLARAYVQNAEPNKAIPVLNQAIATSPDFTDAIILLASLNLQSGQAEAVISAMRALLEKQPGHVQAASLLAAAHQSAGRLDAAVTVIGDLIKAAPSNPDYRIRQGQMLRRAGKIDEARVAFEKALELKPDDLVTIAELIDLDLIQKRFDAAIQKAQRLIEKTPNSAAVHSLLGRIYAVQSEWDKAEAELMKAVELDEGFSPAYALLITTYIKANKIPQALQRLEEQLTKSPANLQALMLSASLYERKMDFGKARDRYEKLLALKPDLPMPLNNLAYLYAEPLNDLPKALAIARKARALRNGVDATADSRAKMEAASIADTLGWILYKQGEYQEALSLLREAANELAENGEFQFHLGMSAYKLGETATALAAFKLAAGSPSDFPGKEEIKSKLALLEGGDGAAMSAADIEVLAKKQPADVVLQTRLAEALEKEKAFPKAAVIYEQVLKLNPTLGKVALKLAQLYAGPLQNKVKALELAKQARQLAPNDPIAAGVLGGIVYQSGSDYTFAYNLLKESAGGLKAGAPATVLQDLAWATYSQGKVPEARQAMQRLLDAHPSSPEATDAKSFLQMIDLAADPKQLAGAAPAVDAVLQKDPNYVPAMMVRAAMQQQTGEAKLAGDACASILKRFPDFAPAQKLLASLYVSDPPNREKGYDLAVKARKTLAADPELTQILAVLSYMKKDYAYAIQLLKESARAKPLDAAGHYYLGMSLSETKEKAASQESLNKALEAGLEDPLASEARKMIEKLGKE